MNVVDDSHGVKSEGEDSSFDSMEPATPPRAKAMIKRCRFPTVARELNGCYESAKKVDDDGNENYYWCKMIEKKMDKFTPYQQALFRQRAEAVLFEIEFGVQQ